MGPAYVPSARKILLDACVYAFWLTYLFASSNTFYSILWVVAYPLFAHLLPIPCLFEETPTSMLNANRKSMEIRKTSIPLGRQPKKNQFFPPIKRYKKEIVWESLEIIIFLCVAFYSFFRWNFRDVFVHGAPFACFVALAYYSVRKDPAHKSVDNFQSVFSHFVARKTISAHASVLTVKRLTLCVGCNLQHMGFHIFIFILTTPSSSPPPPNPLTLLFCCRTDPSSTDRSQDFYCANMFTAHLIFRGQPLRVARAE